MVENTPVFPRILDKHPPDWWGHCDAFWEAALSTPEALAPATELGPAQFWLAWLVLGGVRPEEQLQATSIQIMSPRAARRIQPPR